jgi:hypothetical protein
VQAMIEAEPLAGRVEVRSDEGRGVIAEFRRA